MKIEKYHETFPEIQIFRPVVFHDLRGKYIESFNLRDWNESGASVFKKDFVQDDFSYSHRNVLRGLHGDHKTYKLISCVYGRFLLTLVDCRKQSSTYKKWIQIPMSEEDFKLVFVPPGFANGHYCLSEKCIFHYKQTEYYEKDSQFTVAWNDPELGIVWPNAFPILSARDSTGPFLNLE